MKKLLIAGVICASALLNGVVCSAAIYGEVVNIPFDFKVDNRTMPAGEYRLQGGHFSMVTYLINAQTGRQVQLLRQPEDSPNGKSHLYFTQTGDQYVLKSIR